MNTRIYLRRVNFRKFLRIFHKFRSVRVRFCSTDYNQVNHCHGCHGPRNFPTSVHYRHCTTGFFEKLSMSSLTFRRRTEAFFTYYPHAGRLFSQPVFMSSLLLPSTHSNFPSTAVLHAICGLGSVFLDRHRNGVPTSGDEFCMFLYSFCLTLSNALFQV